MIRSITIFWGAPINEICSVKNPARLILFAQIARILIISFQVDLVTEAPGPLSGCEACYLCQWEVLYCDQILAQKPQQMSNWNKVF